MKKLTVVIFFFLQRSSPKRRKDKVYIGCGAGFGGDRPLAALKLLKRVRELNYLVLECLAERTLADRYQIMVSGGDGYDSRSMVSYLCEVRVILAFYICDLAH